MDIKLHEHQQVIFEDDHRYKVVAAGRRFGKSYLAAVMLFVEAAKNYKVLSTGEKVDLALEEVYYVAPTFEQGKKILWPLLKEIGGDLIATKYENTGTLTLVNGRRISIKGSDRPDSLRGVGLSHVVLDEYAFMKEEVWELIIMPALARTEGGALFIGTPDGKNHFYELWKLGQVGIDPEWTSWTFRTIDSPFINPQEVAKARERMSAERFRQEFEASFESGGGAVFTEEMFPIVEDTFHGDYYVTADLAGFQKVESGRKFAHLDDHAIAVVKVHAGGWHIKDIIHGRWDTRETSLRLVKAYHDWRPADFGIEKGMAMNAVLPYLQDEQNRLGIFFNVEPLTHGNKHKQDRIKWALQGRAEKGRITLEEGPWNRKFIEQACDFPSTLAHDDLLDAVAYIDQIAVPYWSGAESWDTHTALDDMTGY